MIDSLLNHAKFGAAGATAAVALLGTLSLIFGLDVGRSADLAAALAGFLFALRFA